MSVVLFRIDERLLHGQIVTAWAAQTRPDEILVFDDGTAKDSFLSMILRAAVPAGIGLGIHEAAAAPALLQERTENRRTLVIVKDVITAQLLCEKCGGLLPQAVNVGNAGMRHGRIRITDSVYFDEQEQAAAAAMAAAGRNLYFQSVPGAARRDWQVPG